MAYNEQPIMTASEIKALRDLIGKTSQPVRGKVSIRVAAEKLGVHHNTWQNWEYGTCKPLGVYNAMLWELKSELESQLKEKQIETASYQNREVGR